MALGSSRVENGKLLVYIEELKGLFWLSGNPGMDENFLRGGASRNRGSWDRRRCYRGVFKGLGIGMEYDGLEFYFEIILDLGGLSDCHLEDMIPLSLKFLCTMLSHDSEQLIYTMKELIYTTARKIKFPKSTLLSASYAPKSLRHIKTPRPVCQQLRRKLKQELLLCRSTHSSHPIRGVGVIIRILLVLSSVL
jgi:hypothetical protein